MTQNEFGARIAELREKIGMTQAELAEKQARLADLTAELNLDEHSKESQTKEKDSAPKRKPSVLERLKQPLPPSSTPSTKKDERRNDIDR